MCQFLQWNVTQYTLFFVKGYTWSFTRNAYKITFLNRKLRFFTFPARLKNQPYHRSFLADHPPPHKHSIVHYKFKKYQLLFGQLFLNFHFVELMQGVSYEHHWFKKNCVSGYVSGEYEINSNPFVSRWDFLMSLSLLFLYPVSFVILLRCFVYIFGGLDNHTN